MTPQQHADLLRELAYIAQENAEALSDDGFDDQAEECFKAAARARQAAAELEGQREPSDEELIELSYKFWSRDNPWYYQDASCNYARAVIGSLRSLRQGRFGHGEESA